jgi:hypothetical protein
MVTMKTKGFTYREIAADLDQYDSAGRLAGLDRSGRQRHDIHSQCRRPANSGHIAVGNNPCGVSRTFAYDADRELVVNGGNLQTEATSGPGSGQPSVTLPYSHDPSGDITSVKDSLTGSGDTGQGITTYVYDHALRLTTITQSASGTTGPEVTMAYDAVGLITMSVFSNDGLGNIVKTMTLRIG